VRRKNFHRFGHGEGSMPTYEAAIYNKDVKEARARGQSHPRIADEWGSVHFIEVDAMNENMARAKLARDYPESDGFVIDEINPA